MAVQGVEGRGYCGRIAPTPTGLLHLGHFATFRTAWLRAREAGGHLWMRVEDLDERRCRREFAEGAMEDLSWMGLDWDGEPIWQSLRRAVYLEAWRRLRDGGHIYPCRRSRRDVASAGVAPHGEEPVFPIAWRGEAAAGLSFDGPTGVNWRFRVPDGEVLEFQDGRIGLVRREAGVDFGDFVVWNRDDVPAYELAVVVDDLAMGITEIVRGEDLLTSTARQLLVASALGARLPATYHCPLVRDAQGNRLAKRDGATSLRTLRNQGLSPLDLLAQIRDWDAP